MKILWITYVMFPEARTLLFGDGNNLKGSGGWLVGAADSIINIPDIELRVAIVSRQVKQYTELRGEIITYYMIPWGKGFDTFNSGYDIYWKNIKSSYSPDVVHVHGIESTLCHSYINSCGNDNVVASIQGLKGIIARYFRCGISNKEIIRNLTIYDIFFRRSIFDAQRGFFNFGKLEEKMLNELKYVIGRTSWDYCHTFFKNTKIQYFKCNETLRREFYSGSWDYKKCKKHTIFLSAANAPFKGAHQLLKAIPIIIEQYPDTQIRIAGRCNLFPQKLIERLKQSGYGRYLSRLIIELGLKDKIVFLGPLDSIKMKEEYLSANVFVCPSTIENSSNSIAEAQMLGVPVVATFVGGIEDMIPNSEYGEVVRFEEVEMMAYKICEIFKTSPTINNEKIQAFVQKRHNPETNAKRTLEIYQTIIDINRDRK